jgi:hypothetical protein
MKMREGLDEWSTFVAAILMLLRLEERVGTRFGDDDAAKVERFVISPAP